jgi:hypothetical protein
MDTPFPREFCQSIPWSQMQTYCDSIKERLIACEAGLSAGRIVKAWLRIRISQAENAIPAATIEQPYQAANMGVIAT